MKTDNISQDKSFQFGVKVVKACFKIQKENKEFDLSRQLIRSSTSIGANIEEALGGQSKKEFLHRYTISYREARESKYWIRLMKALDLLDTQTSDELMNDAEELCRIIGKIQITTRKKYNL